MKKVYVFILVLFSFMSFPKIASASSQNKHYAKITTNNVYLYEIPKQEQENQLFELPKSFFVELVSQYDESFYKVKYIDITGYVKIDEVSPISSTPLTPYLNNVTFRVYSSDGLQIRSEPYTKNGLETIKGTLTVLDENILYYGKISGEEVVKNRGDSWYFCKYKTERETIYGYVYAGYCDMLTKIEENNEEVIFTQNPFLYTESTSSSQTIQNNENTTKNIVVVLTIIPTLILIFLLFKPFKIINNANKKQVNLLFKKKENFNNKNIYDDFEL